MTRSVIHRFVESANRFPDKPALWAEGRIYSYAELSSMAEAIRRRLVSSGLANVPLIGIMTGTDAATYAAILAILANGSGYVPINRKNPLSRNLAVIEESGISAMLYGAHDDSPPELARTAAAALQVIRISDIVPRDGASLQIAWLQEPALAYLLFTSGSTGTPKGVPISHSNLNSFMAVMLGSGVYSFVPNDRFLQMFELTFDLSIMSMFVPLSVGACCYVVPESRFGAATTLKILQEHAVSIALMVPSILVFLEPHLEKRVRLPDLRLSLFCGEALPDGLVKKWSKSAPNAIIENVYGPTEATIFCLRYVWDPTESPAQAVNGVVPIGKPLPGTGALLLDDKLQVISEKNTKGELVLYGPQLTDGYRHRPEKTASAFVSLSDGGVEIRGYRTGDICALSADGQYVYHGRLDTQVKIDGHRVELGEIEHHVRTVLKRTNFAVVAGAEGSRHFLALFLEKPEVDIDGLASELRKRIPEYMVPHRVEYIESLPLNLNGKVDRPKLVRRLLGP